MSPWLRHLLLAFFLAALSGCTTLGLGEPETEEDILGETLPTVPGLQGKRLVVRDKSLAVMKKASMTFPQKAADLKDQLPGVSEELFEAFRKANKESKLFKGKTLGKHLLVSERKITGAFKEGGWKAFKKQFKGAAGIVGLSRTGFDRKRENALFYYTLTAGPESGSGGFVLLHNDGDRWRVVKTSTQWQS